MQFHRSWLNVNDIMYHMIHSLSNSLGISAPKQGNCLRWLLCLAYRFSECPKCCLQENVPAASPPILHYIQLCIALPPANATLFCTKHRKTAPCKKGPLFGVATRVRAAIFREPGFWLAENVFATAPPERWTPPHTRLNLPKFSAVFGRGKIRTR